MIDADSAVTLSVERLSKNYGHIVALQDVSLEVHRGSVLAIVGDNGAGKSTLLRILAGDLAPTSGVIKVGGVPTVFSSPGHAFAAGIGTVYQDLALGPDLTVAANFYLGRELVRLGWLGRLTGWLDNQRMTKLTAESLEEVRITIPDIGVTSSSLSGGQRQAVAIARAVNWCDKILLLDEPTAALGVEQQRMTLDLIRTARDTGVGIILVSHQLPHVLEIADRIAVLRRGKLAVVMDRTEATEHRLLAAITGLQASDAVASAK